MCGIVGYIGTKKAVPYLIEGLSRLEYRGYDSAGIAVIENEKLNVTKRSGRLNALEAALKSKPESKATVGIGHTRWATHGAPTDENAHPHLSENGLFAVVHNGIIENYSPLKEKLLKENVRFSSQTDTEVVAALLEKNYDGDFLSSVLKTLSALEGTYALAILCKDFPNSLILARKSSPLVLGKSGDGIFAASDVTAVLKHTTEVFKLSDGELALIEGESLSFFTADGKRIKKKSEHIPWSAEDAQKDGYAHFMLKEIFEQPAVFERTISPHIRNGKIEFENFSLSEEDVKGLERIIITACGSAYHAGIIGKYVIEKTARIPVEVDVASEFRYRDPIVGKNTLVIIISQSGETADTLAALRLAKERGARVLSIVNVVGSTIANESENVVFTAAGPEIAVATTKAFSAQVAVLYLLAAYFSSLKKTFSESELSLFISGLQKVPEKIGETIEKTSGEAKRIGKEFSFLEDAYFIGRSLDYAAATEGSLKLKEISYIHSEAYAAGELKHGTISLIENETAVIALACGEELFSKTMSNIKEVVSRGAKVLVVTTEKKKAFCKGLDFVVTVPEVDPLFMPSTEVVFLQLLSYYTALFRNCDIDKPRNLAKSVTVE